MVSLFTPAFASGYIESDDDAESGFASMYDETKNGSISINYQDGEDRSNPVSGAVFNYYKIADLVTEVGEPYEENSIGSNYHSIIENIEVNGETNPAEIQNAVLEYYKDKKVPRGITGTDGICTTELPTGAYLAVESRPAMNHLPSISFMFSIPEAHQEENQVVGWNYNVKAEPKSTPIHIGTTLRDDKTLLHESGFAKDASFTDKVAYSGLIPGKSYIMRGSLIDKESKTPFAITDEVEFVPEDSSGTVELKFKQDTSALNGHKVVAFEDLFINKVTLDETDVNEGETPDMDGTNHTDDLENNPTNKTGDNTEITPGRIRVTTHSEIDDEEQTVHITKILTSLNTGTGKFVEAGKATITDTVSCEGLIPGNKYTLEGVLMDKETKEATTITGSTTFNATSESMRVNIIFDAELEELTGHVLVAFEKLYGYSGNDGKTPENDTESDTTDSKTTQPDATDGNEKVLITTHEDFDDTEQTINVVKIGTTLLNKGTNVHETGAGESILTDTVKYEGLLPGKTYTMTGTLVDKKTGDVITKEAVTKNFTPDNPNGYVDIEFKVDTDKLEGNDIVAFEELSMKKEDAVLGHGNSTDAKNESSDADKNTPDNKQTESENTNANKPALEESDGRVIIAKHKDINDESQTVRVVKIKTTLKEKSTENKKVKPEKVTLIDTVECIGLIPGNKYLLKGTLMEKESKKSTEITAEKEFTAKEINENIDIEFKLDASKYEGKSLVAFEYLHRDSKDAEKDTLSKDESEKDSDKTSNDNTGKEAKNDSTLITSHEDIDDNEQTIDVLKNGEPTPTPNPQRSEKGLSNVKSGDNAPIGVLIGLSILAIATICLTLKKSIFKEEKL